MVHATPPPPVSTKTGKISLQWNASATPTVTYRLYHSTNNVSWIFYSTPGLTYTVTNLVAGSTNWFTATALSNEGIESDPSNVYEASVGQKPAPPTGLINVPIVVQVDSTTNNGATWVGFRRYTNNVIAFTDEPERKFRSTVSVGSPTELTPIRAFTP